MAAEDISVQQDTASGPGADLPQGAASEINAALPTQTVSEGQMLEAPGQGAPAGTEGSAEAEDTSEPELAQDSDYEPLYDPETEDDAWIVGPTTRPDEAVTTGAYAGTVKALSPRLAAAMPTFVEAASMPDAPEQLKTLVALLSQSAES